MRTDSKKELSVYYGNTVYLNHVKRLPVKEYLRWLLFSLIVIIRGLLSKNNVIDECGVYGSQNTKLAIQNVNPKIAMLNIFGNSKDAVHFKNFYSLLFCKLISQWKIIITPKCYSQDNYLEFVTQLYEIMYDCWSHILKTPVVTRIILSNDHLFYNRALIVAASNKGLIKIIYVQHGAIGQSFPLLTHFSELHMFNKFSLMRYPQWTNFAGKIHFNRSDAPIFVKSDAYESILICLNDDLELSLFAKLLNALSDQKKLITIRLHKYVDRNKLKAIPHFPYRVETIYDRGFTSAAQQASIVIGGNSTILMDSLNLGVPCVYVAMAEPHDYYGFVKGGLVPEYTIGRPIEELFEIVDKFDYNEASRSLHYE